MSVLQALNEDLEFDKILDMILLEDVDDILDEPDNFEHDNRGEYTFDIDYTENGEPETLSMNVGIETDCGHGISISFDEQGESSGYKTTNRGSDTKEKMKIVNDKMKGIMYCVGYHLENIACTGTYITFAPIASDKDKKLNKNRRAKWYVYMAKKWLPKLGLEIHNIEGANSGSVIITTDEFGGGGDIEGEGDPYEQAYEALHDAIYSVRNAPHGWADQAFTEIWESGMIEDEHDVSKYDTLTDEVSELFDYMNSIHSADDLVDFTGASEIYNIVDTHSLSDLILDWLRYNGLGSHDLEAVVNSDYVEYLSDAINAAIEYDPDTVYGSSGNMYDIVKFISENPKKENWSGVEWDVEPDVMYDALDDVNLPIKQKYAFLKIADLFDLNGKMEALGVDINDQNETDQFAKEVLGHDSAQTSLNLSDSYIQSFVKRYLK